MNLLDLYFQTCIIYKKHELFLKFNYAMQFCFPVRYGGEVCEDIEKALFIFSDNQTTKDIKRYL